MTPLCPALDPATLANLLATHDKKGNSPAIDYLIESLAGATENDRLADVLLMYATLPGFPESVLCRYLDAAGHGSRATAVASAFLDWHTTPGRWIAEGGKLVQAEPEDTVASRKRAVLAAFPDIARNGQPVTAFLPSI